MADLKEGLLTADHVRPCRDEPEKEFTNVVAVAPDTSPRIHEKTQKALDVDGDMTFSDEELNMFLPSAFAYTRPI